MTMKEAFKVARTAALLGCCLASAGFGLIGCQNTAEGVKEDAAKTGAAVSTGAEKMGEAAKNAGEAATVTPKVKTAITADSKLNDTKNMIDVDTKEGTVYLKGHVLNNEQKKLAGDIAAKAVKDNGSNEKIMNQLTVESH